MGHIRGSVVGYYERNFLFNGFIYNGSTYTTLNDLLATQAVW